MVVVFTVLSLLCVSYWIVLAVYAGPAASQDYIWIIAAAFFFCNALVTLLYRKDAKRIPLWLITAMHTLCAAGMVIFLAVGILIVSGMNPVKEAGLDYVVVLGAKVEENGKPSSSMKKRLDAAIEYADKNPGTVFVLSGWKGKDEPIPEAQAMADYLIFNGVPPERLLLEIQSGNTYENISYSLALIDRIAEEKRGRRGPVPTGLKLDGPVLHAESRPSRTGFLTGDFHIFRTLKTAQRQGVEKPYGIAAKSDPVLFLHLMVRECLAILKDKFLGHI